MIKLWPIHAANGSRSVAFSPQSVNAAPGGPDCLTLLASVSPVGSQQQFAFREPNLPRKRMKSRLHLAAGHTPGNCKLFHSMLITFRVSLRFKIEAIKKKKKKKKKVGKNG